jgi:Zn-dependent protease
MAATTAVGLLRCGPPAGRVASNPSPPPTPDTVPCMFPRALRLTRISGIDVRLDPSLILIAVLAGVSFGLRFAERHALAVASAMALAATVLFFASILAHELAHGLEARHRRIEVRSITLFLFGGVTEMHHGGRRPRDEFMISAVGPYVSLVCGALFGLLATFSPLLGPALAGPVADVAGLLAWLNVALAVFNLIPGAPLDGGRVLRAGLWWLLGDRHRAVRIASRAGQALAVALVAFGVWSITRPGDTAWFGFWWIVIGMFIFQAARGELRQGQVDQLLEQARVGQLLEPDPPVLERDRPLDLVDPGPTGRLLPVLDAGRLVGVLAADRIRGLHPADRSARTAGETMEPAEDLPTVEVDAPLRELVDLLLGGASRVAVVVEGRPVAVLREGEVARGLEALRQAGPSRQARPTPTGAGR